MKQVVAPVRETAAQALATLLPSMPSRSVIATQHILIAMVDQFGAPPSQGLDAKRDLSKEVGGRDNYVWQVRHSGLLGLKYLVAVRGDLVRGEGQAKVGNGEDADGVMRDVKMQVVEHELLLKDVVDAALLGLVFTFSSV